MEYGVTLSPRHLDYLEIPLETALEGIKTLGIKWLRIACYWSEIEKIHGEFDFSQTDKLVTFCEANKINVLMCVGMKAPRWPEFYIPAWAQGDIKFSYASKINTTHKELLTATLTFVKTSVSRYKTHKAIKAWQVENEPLDPSGPSWVAISSGFLKEEIKLVKKLDKKRPIVVNLWGNELARRGLYRDAQKLAAIVGLDIYLRHPIPYLRFLHKYIGPLDSQDKLKSIVKEIKNKKRQVWITELQAEPGNQMN